MLPNFSPANVVKYFKKVNDSSAARPDDLPDIVRHSLAFSLCYPLPITFSSSFTPRLLFYEWKKAFVFPVFKKGDPLNVQIII